MDTHEHFDPNIDTGHEGFIFLAISRALGVIHLLEGLDFKIRTFYDITGSGGLAPIAAGLLFRWHAIKVLEGSETQLERARNMVVTCRVHCHDLHKSDVVYRVGDPLTSDFVEGDVLFVDACVGFDEVALVHSLRQKLEELVCGSFIIICTHVEDPFLGDCPFQKLDWGASYTAPEPSHRHVLLYKTVKRSKDSRTAVTQSRAARARETRAQEMMRNTRLDATFAESMSLIGVNLGESVGLDSLLT